MGGVIGRLFRVRASSLGLRTTVAIAVRTALILAALSITIFYLVEDALEEQAFNNLEANIRERTLRESALFERMQEVQIRANERLRKAMSAELASITPAFFDELFPKHADGSRRSNPALFEGRVIGGQTQIYGMGAFLSRAHDIDQGRMNLMHRALLVVDEVGSTLFPTFESFYFLTPNSDLIIRAPARDDKLIYYRETAPADLDFSDAEFVEITRPENNPTRRIRCTQLTQILYDQGGDIWTTGCMTPVYLGDEYVGAWGSSILLNDLLENAIADHVEDARNMIITADGNLIAHPDFGTEGSEIQRNLVIRQSGSSELNAILDALEARPDEPYFVTEAPDGSAIWAIGKIAVADWYFVITYPTELITDQAGSVVYIVGLIAFFGLMVVLFTMQYTLRKRVVEPLNTLVERTQQLASGDFENLQKDAGGDIEVLGSSPGHGDEIDILTRSTEKMANDLRTIFATLENRVDLRTRELDFARREAERASAAKTDFLANMSHELRTPLTGVLGILDLLADAELKETDRNYVALARQSSNLLLTLVNDILDLSRLEAGKYAVSYEVIEPLQLVKETADSLALLATQKDLEFVLNIENQTGGKYRLDTKVLRQLIVNLVGNAIKFTEAGRVSVDADISDGEGGDSLLNVSVTDTGTGIPPDALHSVFDRFKQMKNVTDEMREGSGLGLAICYDLVELLGGTINVESELGVGSKFSFSLPIQISDLDENEEVLAADGSTLDVHQIDRLRELRLLAVDDNIVNRMLIEKLCRKFCGHIDVVSSGPEMIDAFKASLNGSGQEYDLLLMDINMPDMDGIETLSHIRNLETDHSVPVIALTADALEGAEDKYRSHGMQGYTSKPIVLLDLKREILRCLE